MKFRLTGDEQADTDAFEEYVGGVSVAQRLFHVWKETYPKTDRFNKPIPKRTLFKRRALIEGFRQEQVGAALLFFR